MSWVKYENGSSKLIENMADASYFCHQLMLVVVNGVTQMHVENKLKFVISIL